MRVDRSRSSDQKERSTNSHEKDTKEVRRQGVSKPVPIKESSDELNTPAVVPSEDVATNKRRTATDYLALAISTCGVGYAPIAPGTVGSLVGVAVFVTLRWVLIRLTVGPVISF